MNFDAQQILRDLSKRFPDLCAWGLAVEPLRRRNGVRTKVPIDPEEFETCVDWLARCTLRKTVNLELGTSYGLKHQVERWAGRYVTNGAFIAAVIFLRIPFKCHPESPNIKVAISSKGLPGGTAAPKAISRTE